MVSEKVLIFTPFALLELVGTSGVSFLRNTYRRKAFFQLRQSRLPLGRSDTGRDGETEKRLYKFTRTIYILCYTL